MIVCSCNVLSDTVRTVANTATRRTTSYVYSCLGCRARCGRCARNIREIMDEVFDGAKVGHAYHLPRRFPEPATARSAAHRSKRQRGRSDLPRSLSARGVLLLGAHLAAGQWRP